MRLVLVHGINNQKNSAAKIKAVWSDVIRDTAGAPDLFTGVDVVAPFYGKELARLAKPGAESLDAVAQGGADAVPIEDTSFALDLLEEIADDLGVPEEEIEALKGPEFIEQGLILDKVLHPLFRAIEKHVPGAGNVALFFIQQANTYFNVPGARETIDAMVRPDLETGEAQVVIGHSLGSVVTYSVLREMSSNTPLYLTLGSPLSLLTIRRKLGPPKKIPDGVARWVNGIDPSDPVGLGNDISNAKFVSGIHPIQGIDNGFGMKAHSIEGYLSNKDVVAEIVAALR